MTCHQKYFTPYQRNIIAQLETLLGERTFSYEKSANNHLQIKIEGINRVFHSGSTPSDHRSGKNFISEIKAALHREHQPVSVPDEPPRSQQKAKAKRMAEDLVNEQQQQLERQLKKKMRTLRKEEYKMLTQLQDSHTELLSPDLLSVIPEPVTGRGGRG